jgi:hypothetical protein
MHEESSDVAIHPDAEMCLLVSYGELVRGRTEIGAALARGREAGTWYVRVKSFEWLDSHTSLTSGFARYPLKGGGFAEGRVYWIDEIRGGMLWRARVFKTEAEARAAYGS